MFWLARFLSIVVIVSFIAFQPMRLPLVGWCAFLSASAFLAARKVKERRFVIAALIISVFTLITGYLWLATGAKFDDPGAPGLIVSLVLLELLGVIIAYHAAAYAYFKGGGR